ncbi:MAG TPA: translation initiation factor IF-2 [Syntrophales bacterium]|nr:translation initiation factor IF-2 [Syntrophales bacterium]HPN23924.1 translation initiation factor IF-2 [Syntrophales bacterium]
MSKTRVYELAKEFGTDSKELISRLKSLGITVKSHSSTLEDSEVQRVREEFAAPGAKEIVEQRIKSTVIRRRAVRQPVEEVKAAEPEPVVPVQPAVEEPPKEAVAERKEPARKEVTPPVPEKDALAKVKPPEPKAAIPEEKPPVEAAAKASEEARVKEEAPGKAPEKAVGAPVEAGKAVRKEAPKAPEPKAAEEAEKKDKVTIVKPFKKTSKQEPVEVIMDETPERKKAFIKQVVARKEKRKGREVEEEIDRGVRWREKKAPVVKMKKTEITVPKAIKRRIKVEEAIRVGDLAKKMGVRASDVINKLLGLGMMVTINQSIDIDAASLIAAEFGYQIEAVATEFDEALYKAEASSANMKPRAPVVTVMGHVDHGKTSLLDAIRQTNVIEGEAGGITQAIGAYHVNIKGRDIVFLDTPGHEAFTAMRARGAQVTDIVILVVAADDGVMEQTVEAINHSRVAGVPIIVAVNKIDKPGANVEKIKQELVKQNLVPEEWGGDVLFAEISAKKKTGIENLLEVILLQADVLELKADPDRAARGVIIEAKLDRGRGPVATVLIQEGTLREGDAFVSKREFGRVRAMVNDQGQRIREAGPSMPVEVIGFSNVPQAGSEFICVEDEKKARGISEYFIRKEREKELAATSKVTLEQLYARIKEGVKELNVILKADVQGSIEALAEALAKLSTPEIKVRMIHSSTGAITETDVMLASASDALIIGFKVRPDARVVEVAEVEGIEMKLYDVIYDVINDVKAAMEGLLEPEYRETVQGHAEVREVFKISKVGTIAGSHVTDGKISRNANVRLLREGVVVYDGKILSLKRFKDDAREVAAGLECGIAVENFNDIKTGDVVEAYTKEKVERKL